MPLNDTEFDSILNSKSVPNNESCTMYHEVEGEFSIYEVDADLRNCPKKWVDMMTKNGSFNQLLKVFVITLNDKYGIGELDDPRERGRYPERVYWTRKGDTNAADAAYSDAANRFGWQPFNDVDDI